MPKKHHTTHQQSVRAQRAEKRQQQRKVVVGVMIGAGLLLVFLLLLPTIIEAAQPVGEIVTPEQKPWDSTDFNTVGDPNAPVKIAIFSDFQCPFCKKFSDDTEYSIYENYVKPGKVFMVYVPYGPGGNYIGPESEAAANAAFCAAEQGKFWEYKDIVFANHTGENVGDFTDKRLTAFAENIGLDIEQFKACFKKQKYADKLDEGIAEGRRLGAGGTPAFFFNDGAATLTGALPYEKFAEQIEALLNP
jgi:protein-disulfide isomerase